MVFTRLKTTIDQRWSLCNNTFMTTIETENWVTLAQAVEITGQKPRYIQRKQLSGLIDALDVWGTNHRKYSRKHVEQFKKRSLSISKTRKEAMDAPVIAGNHSPVPVEELETRDEMTFSEAMDEVILGKNITRLEWKDASEYGYLDHKDERLRIFTKGKHHEWLVSKADMLAEDWIVVN